MKKVCILLFACLQMLNLTAQTAPLEEEPQDSVAKVQFLEKYNEFCSWKSDSLYNKFESIDWDKPQDDSFYALLLACLPHLDGDFAESYSYVVYHYFEARPEEFTYFKTRLQYLPSETREKALNELFYQLLFELEVSDVRKEEYVNQFLKSFPRATELFPDSLIHKLYYVEDVEYKCLSAYIYDRHDKTANIRTAPNGKVVGCLDNNTPIRILSIEGNWCRLDWSSFFQDETQSKIALLSKELWVHKSCVSGKFYWNNGIAVYLQRDYDDEKNLIKVVISDETNIDGFIEWRDDLVKVKLKDGTVGWINKDNISNRFSD